MRFLKKLILWCVYLLAVPVIYVLISLILTAITIDKKDTTSQADHVIFLSTNGVHLDIVLPKERMAPNLLRGLFHGQTDRYFSFGWGDENFYLNTPTWNDLTFRNAFGAMFLRSSTLMHVSRHRHKQNDWVQIPITKNELKQLNEYIYKTFKKDSRGNIIMLKNQGYTDTDEFYRAYGSYSCINTCNSWVNSAFKKSGLKSCYWTPFDFGVLNKYE